ncbi:MAG: hypothetical protein ACE5HN_08760 [Nitrospiria bacterium]
MFQKEISFVIFLSMIMSTSIASAGLVLRFEAKKSMEEKSHTMTFMLEGEKLRIEDSRGGIMIFDGDQQKLWTIDLNQKKYSEFTKADAVLIQEMRKKMKLQMEEQMGRLPPEQQMQLREMLKQMDEGNDTPPRVLTFEAGGAGRKTDRGFSCRPYRVIEKGKPIEEICFILWEESGFSLGDFRPLDAFGRFLQKMGTGTSGKNQIFYDLRQAPGIPAHVVVVAPGNQAGHEQVLTALKRKQVPANRFTLPKGFQKEPVRTRMGDLSR